MFKSWKLYFLLLVVLIGAVLLLKKPNTKLELIVFVAPECPISEAIILNLKQISFEFNNDELHTTLVIPGSLYSQNEVDSFIKLNKISFDVIIDSSAQLVNKYKAQITPEVFLINNEEIIYTGAVDDRAIDNEIIKQSASENYLYDAIKNTLEGNEVKVKKTKAIGCFIEL